MHSLYHALTVRPTGNTDRARPGFARALVLLAFLTALGAFRTPARGAMVEARSCEMRIPADWTAANVRRQIDRLADMGLNAVRVETFYHGGTVYRSGVMAKWGLPAIRPDFAARPDLFAALIAAAHARGMSVYAWVETFYVWNSTLGSYNPILSKYPQWSVRNADGTDAPRNGETAYRYISPANLEARQFLKELYAETAQTGVDGLLIDYLRYPVGALGPQNALSYDTASVQRAKDELGLDITKVRLDLNDPDFARWTAWRIRQTTDFAKELAGAVRAANPAAAVVASVHPYPGDDWRMWDTLRDWPAWWPEVKVFSPQYYSDLATARAQIGRDMAAMDPRASLWPDILSRDIGDGSPLFSYIRTQPILGASYWVFSSLTDADGAALKAGLFAEPALEPGRKPRAGAALLVENALPALPESAKASAGAAAADLSAACPCTAPAAKRLADLLASTDLADGARRDLDLAYRVSALAPETALAPGDVDGDGRATVADAVRVLRAALTGSGDLCMDAADLAPPGGDLALTPADAGAILARGLGLR